MNCLQTGDRLKRSGLPHEVGEVVFKARRAQAMRPRFQRVADATPDCPHRGLTVESAEDIARSEADKQTAHLRQQIGGEEGNSDGVAVFEVATHLGVELRAQLFQCIAVVTFDP